MKAAAGRFAFPVAILLCAAAAVAMPGVEAGTHRTPRSGFDTHLPWLLSSGEMMGSLSASYFPDDPGPFGSYFGGEQERDRILYQIEWAGALSENVEVSLRGGAIRTSGGIGGISGNGTNGTGNPSASDLHLAFGTRLSGSPGSARALSARFTAKVPTAAEQGQAGTDESDLGVEFSWGARAARAGIFLAAGIELLGNPIRNGSQDDVANYGAGGWIKASKSLDFLGEIRGRAFSRFDNSGATVRLGGQWNFRREGGGLNPALFFLLTRGISGSTHSTGFSMGLSVRKFH
jgi:hypothetical protein